MFNMHIVGAYQLSINVNIDTHSVPVVLHIKAASEPENAPRSLVLE